MKIIWGLLAVLSFSSTVALAATPQLHIAPVSEPFTILIIGCGLVGLSGYVRTTAA